MTSALSTQPSWHKTYGIFSEAEHWEKGVIRYFGYKNSGISGLLLSFEYSIAYMSVSEAKLSGVAYAQMVNSFGKVTSVSSESVQAAMDQAAKNAASLTVNLVDHPSPNAYPIASYTYMITYINSSSECAAMLEYYRYVRWFMYEENARRDCEDKSMVPLSVTVANYINEHILMEMTCKGEKLLDGYNTALNKERFQHQLIWLIPTLVSVGLLLVIIFAICIYFTIKAVRFRQLLNKNEWAIDISDILFYTTYKANNEGRQRFVMWQSVTSLTEVEDIDEGYQMVAQILQWPGKLNGNTVGLRLLEIKAIAKLTKDLKILFLWMKDHINHTNVLKLIGLSELQESWYCVSDYCSKGPLFNILKDVKYNLTKDFKHSMAMDIASGLQYLHSKDIIIGCLRSSSCLVDYKWSVKIADWEYVKIYTKVKKKQNPLVYMRKNADEIGLEEAAYLDFWMAPEILKSNLTVHPDERSDTYSYGIILHEIFSRQEPYAEHYGAMSYSDLLKAVINNHLRPQHSEDTPTNIRQILGKYILGCYNKLPLSIPVWSSKSNSKWNL